MTIVDLLLPGHTIGRRPFLEACVSVFAATMTAQSTQLLPNQARRFFSRVSDARRSRPAARQSI